MRQFCETSLIFELDNVKNETILRDFLIFRSWQRQKTKQFCETSFKNGKLSAELTECILRCFHSSCLKYCACHEKVRPGRHTKCCTCHAKSSQQTWRSDAPKCNPSQEISALTSEQPTCLLYCACHAKDIFADPLQMPHACHCFRECYKTLTFCSTSKNGPSILYVVFSICLLPTVLRAASPCTFWTSQLPKVVRTWCALYILTSTCASRHNGVHFFDISTSKSADNVRCF